MKKLIPILILLILGGVVFAFRERISSQISYEGPSDIETATPKTTPDEFTILFAGDIILDRDVKKKIDEVGGGDWRFPFLRIADFSRSAELTMANLEGPVSDRRAKVGSIYSFRFDPASLEALTYAGIDIVNSANNHIFDYGQQGLLDTITNLTRAGIDYVGIGLNFEQTHQGITKNIKGTKITFLGYTDLVSKQLSATPTAAGISFLDKEQMTKDIQAAKANSDIVIINVHKGDEYHTSHNAEQEMMYKAAIDAGADLVVGHHPHVAQEVEQYRDGWIAYSLGNFVFDQGFSEETMRGLFLKVTVRNKKIVAAEPIPFNISPNFQPYLP